MSFTKSYHLEQIHRLFGFRPDEIVLLDDCMTNCIQAVQEGYIAIHVSGKSGFSYAVLNGVL